MYTLSTLCTFVHTARLSNINIQPHTCVHLFQSIMHNKCTLCTLRTSVRIVHNVQLRITSMCIVHTCTLQNTFMCALCSLCTFCTHVHIMHIMHFCIACVCSVHSPYQTFFFLRSTRIFSKCIRISSKFSTVPATSNASKYLRRRSPGLAGNDSS